MRPAAERLRQLIWDRTSRPGQHPFWNGLLQELPRARRAAKVWLHAVESSRLAHISTAQSIEGAGESLNRRIEQLLTLPGSPHSIMYVRTGRLPISISTVMLLLISQAVSSMLTLTLMGCGPILLLGRLI